LAFWDAALSFSEVTFWLISRDRIMATSQTFPTPAAGKTEHQTPAPAKPATGCVHSVRIHCHNVFRVPADKFDAKHGPNCHKG
jgi:hypothetical protein